MRQKVRAVKYKKSPDGIHFKVTPEGSGGPDVVPREKPHSSYIPWNPLQQDNVSIFSSSLKPRSTRWNMFHLVPALSTTFQLFFPIRPVVFIRLLLFWWTVCLGYQAVDHPSCKLRWAAELVVFFLRWHLENVKEMRLAWRGVLVVLWQKLPWWNAQLSSGRKEGICHGWCCGQDLSEVAYVFNLESVHAVNVYADSISA